MRAIDHTDQLRRIDADLERSLRLLRLLEWLHRTLSLVLVFAGAALIKSTFELFAEPDPSTATWLIIELIAIAIHLAGTPLVHLLRSELDIHAAQLRHELELKVDGLRQQP